jgi:hypothetical protein
MYEIKSYAAEEFPIYFKKAMFSVKTLEVERTFWEKATLLHAEFYRPESQSLPPRYSRHYYDVALMIKEGVGDRGLSDLKLLDTVRNHNILFYSRKWANYDKACPGTFRLLPPSNRLNELKHDYQLMTAMIFADVPKFEYIMDILKLFEDKINKPIV